MLEVIRKKEQLRDRLKNEKSVGFVPTMGALHEGHLSLVNASTSNTKLTVASIFVNPTQFNNPEDLEKYPVDTEADLTKLESAGCHVAFLPNKEEMYARNDDEAKYQHDFGFLATKYEGAFRPGHFQGVGQIVHKLFETVQPQKAFFGEKDFQQVQIIRSLVKKIKANIEIIALPTIREKDGLAMSSRNRRLSSDQRQIALALFEALNKTKAMIKSNNYNTIVMKIHELFKARSGIELEYFDIINPSTFEPEKNWENTPTQAIVSAYVGEIRLIDNMRVL